MKLKKIIETANWHKLKDNDFRRNATDLILEHEEKIEKLNNLITDLINDVNHLKQTMQFINAQVHSLKRQARTTPNSIQETNQRITDANNSSKQKRNY